MEETKPIFSTGNKHSASCGQPPSIVGGKGRQYCGYFENEYGEQAVFVYDSKSQTGTLWMGDYGWENAVPVKDGVVEELVLNEAEALWLKACWLAASATVTQNPE